MDTEVTNVAVDSSTAEMKDTTRQLARVVSIGILSGLIAGFLTALWIAGSDWAGTMVATTLAVMIASAAIGGLMGANFASE